MSLDENGANITIIVTSPPPAPQPLAAEWAAAATTDAKLLVLAKALGITA